LHGVLSYYRGDFGEPIGEAFEETAIGSFGQGAAEDF
jgi:hypothetical protein